MCEDGDGVSRDSRQDVLGAVVANFFVVVHVSLQHILDPANHAVAGAWPREKHINSQRKQMFVMIINTLLEIKGHTNNSNSLPQ